MVVGRVSVGQVAFRNATYARAGVNAYTVSLRMLRQLPVCDSGCHWVCDGAPRAISHTSTHTCVSKCRADLVNVDWRGAARSVCRFVGAPL